MEIKVLVNSGTYPEQVLRFCPVCGYEGFLPDKTAGNPPGAFLCMQCDFLYFINAAASVIALIEKQPGILLMTRRLKEPAAGTLDLPGGFVDLQETAEEAVIREVYEECGLQVSQAALLNKTFCNEYQYKGFTYFTLDLVFRCEIEDWSQLIEGDNREVYTELIQVSSLDLDLIGFNSVRNVVEDYVNSISGEPPQELT